MSRRQDAIIRGVGEFQLDGIRGAIGNVRTLLGIADVTNFAVGGVIPGKRRAYHRGNADLRVCHSFRQFMAGHGRVVAEHRRRTATSGATAARLHVRQYAVKDVLGVECVIGGAVIRAETAPHAA